MLKPAEERERVFARDDGTRRRIEPIPCTGKEETQTRPARQHRKRRTLGLASSECGIVTRDERIADRRIITSAISLKRPSGMSNRQIPRANLSAGEVEIDHRTDGITNHQDIIWEQVGVDHASRQIMRPMRFEEGAFGGDARP